MPPTARVKPSRSATSSSESSAPDPAAFFAACSPLLFGGVWLRNSDGGLEPVPGLIVWEVPPPDPFAPDVSTGPVPGPAAWPGVLPAAVAPIEDSGGAGAERGDVVVPVGGLDVVVVCVAVGELLVGGGLVGVVAGDAGLVGGDGFWLDQGPWGGEPELGGGPVGGVVDADVVVGVRSAVTEGGGPGGRRCPGGGSDPGIGEPAGDVGVVDVGVVVGDEVVDAVVVGDDVLVAGQFRLILPECTDRLW
jgi:hypothetical protein